MKNEIYFTTDHFAKLHRLNKRTLHYYDMAGLFSPAYRGGNGYRYYSSRQSAELEYILSLRELGLSIEEIKAYRTQPNADDFLRIASQKTHEIDEQIRRLKRLKKLLLEKQNALAFCRQVYDGKIEITQLSRQVLLLAPIQIKGDALCCMKQIMEQLQAAWTASASKAGCGSYISLDKVKRMEFDAYDGIFAPLDKAIKGRACIVRPKGKYLCGYCVGDWGRIPNLYRQMLDYARANSIGLTGNCYEIGMNEHAISHADEYVTQIIIQCAETDDAK